MLDRAWKRWLAVLLFWTLLGLFFATQTGMTYLYAQGSAPWGLVVKISLGEWYVWALLTPAVVWLARRFPFERGRRLRAVAVLAPLSLVFTAAKLLLEQLVREQVLQIPGRFNPVSKLHFAFLTFWAIVGVAYAFRYYQKYRERELATSRLQTQLARAELQALQTQLQPHFLFNTLHAISTLMHRDVDAAERMLAQLSDLLRMTLESSGVQEVPLQQEMDFLGRYLEIEQIRFADRLSVETRVDPDTLGALVPNLLLQPLVENAVRHGIAPRAQRGRILISARREAGRLRLEVADDGVGLPAEKPHGRGLTNTRARLTQLYGADHQFDVANRSGGGVSVTITIPFRTAGEHP